VNVAQALETIPGLLNVLDRSPDAPPAGAYAVVSELTEGISRQQFRQQGVSSDLKELTVLVTLYGAEGSEKADLRPLWLAAKKAQDQITRSPGIPYLIGVQLGPALPPTFDADARRPMAGVRFILNYRE
jgi:hypothetical protein